MVPVSRGTRARLLAAVRDPPSNTVRLAHETDPFFDRYCVQIQREPTECLQACEPEIIKTYLEWRAKGFRVRKESTMKSYWKRLSCGYIDAAGRRMDNGTELDVRDV